MATRFADHLLTGVIDDRPAATAVPTGTLYASSDEGIVYQSDGATWGNWAVVAGGGGAATDTIFDAKGDLVAATAADTAARLAVGTNGQVLTADSAETTGVKWATPSAGTPGAVTLLHTLTLGSAGTFDQSSISGSYNDLICVLVARGTNAAVNEKINWNFNGDTGTNYRWANLNAGTSTPASEATGGTAVAFLQGGRLPGNTGLANAFGLSELTIVGYKSTTWLKICHYKSFDVYGTGAGSLVVDTGGGFWNSTAAITRIQVAGQGTANLATGSQLRIYGRL